jgi:hypothetical protein
MKEQTISWASGGLVDECVEEIPLLRLAIDDKFLIEFWFAFTMNY